MNSSNCFILEHKEAEIGYSFYFINGYDLPNESLIFWPLNYEHKNPLGLYAIQYRHKENCLRIKFGLELIDGQNIYSLQ